MPKNERPGPYFGKWMCWHRRKNCNNKECRHRPNNPDWSDEICEHCGVPLNQANWRCKHNFSADEYDLWECPECGADRHCRMPVQEDGDACDLHGGASLKGVASPRWVDGKRSKYLPRDLLQGYEEFMEHPNRLQVEEALALVRAMYWEEAKKLDEIGSAASWSQAIQVYDWGNAASEKQDREKFAKHWVRLGEILKKGAGQASTRDEIRKLIEQERKLVDTQRQIYVDMGEFMTRQMVLTAMGFVLEAVKENIVDLPDGLRRLDEIAEAVERIFGRVNRGRSKINREDIIEGESRVP